MDSGRVASTFIKYAAYIVIFFRIPVLPRSLRVPEILVS